MSDYPFKDSATKQAVYNWLKEALVQYSVNSAFAWADEDSLCQLFLTEVGRRPARAPGLDVQLQGYKTRGRGGGAGEKKLGADGLGVVRIETTHARVDGFFLFQAKKSSAQDTPLDRVREQSLTMLSHTSSSIVLVLCPGTVEVVSAMAVASHNKPQPRLSDVPYEDFARFVTDKLLRGFAMAPLDSAAFLQDAALRGEIKQVLAIVAAEAHNIAAASVAVQQRLDAAGLNVERLRPIDPTAEALTIKITS